MGESFFLDFCGVLLNSLIGTVDPKGIHFAWIRDFKDNICLAVTTEDMHQHVFPNALTQLTRNARGGYCVSAERKDAEGMMRRICSILVQLASDMEIYPKVLSRENHETLPS